MTITTQSFSIVNVGASANDGTGDELRTAFVKVNSNFAYMGNTGFTAGNISATAIEASSLTTTANVTAVGVVAGNLAVNGTGGFNRINSVSLNTTGNVVFATSYVPLTAADGGTAGQIAYDADYVYICVATNSWKRANLAAW